MRRDAAGDFTPDGAGRGRFVRWIPYAVSFAAGALIATLIAAYQGFSFGGSAAWNARCLSDGFFVAATLLIGIGGLLAISTTGFFDMFSYGFYSLWVLFTPFKKPKDHPAFYDYKLAKEERRGKPRYSALLTGVFFLLLSLLCLALYYRLG